MSLSRAVVRRMGATTRRIHAMALSAKEIRTRLANKDGVSQLASSSLPFRTEAVLPGTPYRVFALHTFISRDSK